MENSQIALTAMVLVLGIQHGFDLDHLSIIDSMTRTMQKNKFLAKMIGILFSLGHGLVVTTVSIIIGSGMIRFATPRWLDTFGNCLSTFFLLIFAFLTFWNIFQSNKKRAVSTSLNAFLLGKLITKKLNPFFIILTGALFAFSFDTFSQAALFSISASLLAGWIFAGFLGIIFMCGMMISDGLNGLLVSTLLQRADKKSILISRFFSVSIALFSLSVGLFNLTKLV